MMSARLQRLRRRFCSQGSSTIRGAAIGVVRVVVVEVAGGVRIPRIIRVTAIRRTQAAVLRRKYSLQPVYKRQGVFTAGYSASTVARVSTSPQERRSSFESISS